MKNTEIEEAIKIVQELHDRCRADGFLYEVNHGNMSQEEADREIAIQMRFKKGLATALTALHSLRDNGRGLGEERIASYLMLNMRDTKGIDDLHKHATELSKAIVKVQKERV